MADTGDRDLFKYADQEEKCESVRVYDAEGAPAALDFMAQVTPPRARGTFPLEMYDAQDPASLDPMAQVSPPQHRVIVSSLKLSQQH